MAGLCQRYAQKFHPNPMALMLVFTLLLSQCLASLQPMASWEIHPAASGNDQQQHQSVAREPQSLRHILKRSVAASPPAAAAAAATSANTRDSSFEKHNFTDVNNLQRNPPLSKLAKAETSSLLKENIQTKTAIRAGAPSTMEMESSGREAESRETDFLLAPIQQVEYLRTNTEIIEEDVDENEQYHPVVTERTRPADPSPSIISSSSSTSSTTTAPDLSNNGACPGCVKTRQHHQKQRQRLDPEAIRNMRIETIKMQILSKLKFEKPPNVTRGQVNIPVPLSDGHFGGTEEELLDYSGENEIGDKSHYAKTTQVIISAKDEYIYCPTKSPNAGCFEFDLTQATGMQVVSAELWVYKLATPTGDPVNQTLVVSQLASRHSRIKKELVRQSVSLHEPGWITFEMKHKVQNMINHSQRHQRLEIFCEDCDEFENDFPISSKAGYRPFLAISTRDPTPRKPRSIDCEHGTTDCCRERFYVSFAEIGWDWIIQPKGYHANYCRGSCDGPVIPRYAHTSVIHGFLAKETYEGSSLGDAYSEILPCCAPKSTKGISLIYYDDAQLIYRRNLPDMVIESCACS